MSDPQDTDTPKLSSSVLSYVESNLANFHNKLKINQSTSADHALALSSLRLLFAHMDETGYNRYLNRLIAANLDSMVSQGIPQSRIDSLLGAVASKGIYFSDTEVRVFSADQQDIIAFASKFRAIGVSGIEGEILNEFSSRACFINTCAE